MARRGAIETHLNINNIVDGFVHLFAAATMVTGLCCVLLPFFDRSFAFDSNGQISGMCRE